MSLLDLLPPLFNRLHPTTHAHSCRTQPIPSTVSLLSPSDDTAAPNVGRLLWTFCRTLCR